MRIPSWVVTAAALVMALPFGWGLGVIAAFVVAGKEFGQLPVATVPLGIVASFVFALWQPIRAGVRLAVLVAGTVVFIAVARLLV